MPVAISVARGIEMRRNIIFTNGKKMLHVSNGFQSSSMLVRLPSNHNFLQTAQPIDLYKHVYSVLWKTYALKEKRLIVFDDERASVIFKSVPGIRVHTIHLHVCSLTAPAVTFRMRFKLRGGMRVLHAQVKQFAEMQAMAAPLFHVDSYFHNQGVRYWPHSRYTIGDLCDEIEKHLPPYIAGIAMRYIEELGPFFCDKKS